MNQDLTRGNIAGGLVAFALPMIAGDLLQQVYNLTDTLIVGQALGRGALAAVGSAYSLMTFLVSIFLGLSMGTGALFSIYLGRGDRKSLRSVVFQSFALIMGITLLLNLISYAALDPLLGFLQIPREIRGFMRLYLCIIFYFCHSYLSFPIVRGIKFLVLFIRLTAGALCAVRAVCRNKGIDLYTLRRIVRPDDHSAAALLHKPVYHINKLVSAFNRLVTFHC